MDRFKRIHELRDAYESALDDAERLRDEYHREVVKLHRSGMSLREIAEGLGISHQRVHQIVAPLEAPRSRRRRPATAAGAIAAIAIALGVGSALLMAGGPLDPSGNPITRATAAPDGNDGVVAMASDTPAYPTSCASGKVVDRIPGADLDPAGIGPVVVDATLSRQLYGDSVNVLDGINMQELPVVEDVASMIKFCWVTEGRHWQGFLSE